MIIVGENAVASTDNICYVEKYDQTEMLIVYKQHSSYYGSPDRVRLKFKEQVERDIAYGAIALELSAKFSTPPKPMGLADMLTNIGTVKP